MSKEDIMASIFGAFLFTLFLFIIKSIIITSMMLPYPWNEIVIFSFIFIIFILFFLIHYDNKKQ